MSTAYMTRLRRLLLSSVVATAMPSAGGAFAQTPPLANSTADSSPSPVPAPTSPAGASMPPQPALTGSRSGGLLGPEFQFNASVFFSESYVNNPAGIAGQSRSDYMSSPGLTADLHEHSARITLDADYNGFGQFYAEGTVPTQFVNHLMAVGKIEVFPEYLDIDLRAFAQPVTTSNFGVVSAGDSIVPGGFRNSYGYYETPDLHFNWGDFASFKTMPSVGQVFFSVPPGTSAANTIPGVLSPENTTLRSVTEEISSGTDFDVLKWKLVGLFSETDRQQSLLSEKSGIANAQYALSHQWSLLATGGYDSISDTIPLTHDISGPVALGGLGLTFGQDFSLQAQAGERYNSLSFNGNLRYDLSPTSLLTASANDYVQTPEGQLLNNLTSLTALPNGTLTSNDDILENGTASSLTSFNIQSPDDPSLDQLISRYQVAALSLLEQLERTQASLSLFATRRTMLTGGFTGSPVIYSWGTQILASRNLNPLLAATLGATYSDNEEFGGHASTVTIQGQITYSLSRATEVFLQSNYLNRISSSSLTELSPLAGNVSTYRLTLGIRHAL